MKQCWDADPSKRPDIKTLINSIDKLNLSYQTKSNESSRLEENNNLEIETYSGNSKLFTSKLHRFDNLPEPRNATEDEQEAFHNDFHIPNNSSKKNNISKIFKAAKSYPIYLKEAQKMIEPMQQQTMNLHIKDNDEGEMYNNPNLRSFRRIR
uniref:Serine-threonine/tyrosine-protein kinase catalytic domain-containing protein n=1 Tax=Rhizophagus irregularis (strain DAOM 181602 / DAOM 197198 / MUCL 43194) TaxID=747089 RepID=U9T6E5_RHIID